jgi:hypothetical protein
MLIFWGCGEHAPAGQPVVIDFAKVAAGQMPAGLWSTQVPLDRWVSPTTSRTYGVWPNADDRKTLSPDSALPGAHRVVANYAPDMNFNLTHDFMAPLRVTSQGQPSGAIIMQWSPLADATGYYASLMGEKAVAVDRSRIWSGGRHRQVASSAAASRTGCLRQRSRGWSRGAPCCRLGPRRARSRPKSMPQPPIS